MKKLVFFGCLWVLLSGCKKGFLDAKPDKSLLVPATTADMQELLDNAAVFNITPGITGIADGDYFTTDAAFKAWGGDFERNSYTWAPDIWGTIDPKDFQAPYQQVFYSNVILDGLKNVPSDGLYNTVKGTALFSRAFAYYNLAQEFTLPYRPASSATDPGLSIRLASDVTQLPPRSTLQATYQQILSDLLAARPLLPKTTSIKSRPTLGAAYALLARTYLVMNNYVNAGLYADSALQQFNYLINYNTLSTTATRPFPSAVNPATTNEVIYYASQTSYSYGSNASTLVDTNLYRSYVSNDLRKVLLYKTSGLSGTFKGNYSGILALFSGMATDEMYLIRAECFARQGNTNAALNDLNTLLAKRWKTGTYVNQTAASADAALALILTERRKELVGRTMRWSDLKRLNADSRFALTLSRTVLGTAYTLAPDSKRYAYPLPLDEINLGGGPQNDR